MNNPGNVSSSGTSTPGDLSFGEATQPGNMGNIMQNMFSQMVTPEQVPDPSKPAPTQPEAPKGQPQTVVLTEPQKQNVEIKEPNLGLFTEEPEEKVEPLQVDEEPDMSDIPEELDAKAQNWKKARDALKAERKNIKILTKDFETTKAKLEKYEKGETIPEVLTAKDLRIQQLESYETIVQGRLSEEYQELVVKPVNEKTTQLKKIAEDYGVPENIRDALAKRIVETENERERNQLITKYFPDAIGATKVEGLVKELHALGEKAISMDKKPAETLQTLQAQYKEKKDREAAIIANEFEAVSKNSWSKALEKTAEEGLFPELIMDPTNAEHSQKAEKNQHRAGIQYGALVKKLHENGLKTLPEDLATGLARSIQLAIGSVGIAKQLQAAQARIAELEGTGAMIATYMRPGVNSNGAARPPVNPAAQKGPTSPQEAAKAAMAVFGKS